MKFDKTSQSSHWKRTRSTQKGLGHVTLTLVVLAIASLCFPLFLFPVTTAGEVMKKPNINISSKGKQGVTPPSSSVDKDNIKQNSTGHTKPVSSDKISSMSKQEKPTWTQFPLFVDPLNSAAEYVANNPMANGSNYIARMAQVPIAQWFGDWNGDVTNDTRAYVSAAATKNSIPVLVLYNIPHRDCGGYSIGGAGNGSVYAAWVQQVANGIGNYPAVVIVEPDALGALDCLPVSQRQERTQLMAQAVTVLKTHANVSVYIDAGTAAWQPADVMATRLKAANVSAADGFSLNISYFAPTAMNYSYGDQLSSLIDYKHYIVDTSRNGGNHTVTGAQCNPSFASLGELPTTTTGSILSDGLLWIKIPWESDGECNGSPGPGEPYWDYAIQLAKNAGW